MAEAARVAGDLVVTGAILGATSIAIPDNSIVNADISGEAAIAASKLQANRCKDAQQSGTVADETIVLHVVKGATGTLKHFTISQVTAPTGTSVFTVDLQKDGVTVLSAVVTANAATGAASAGGKETGTLTVTALVAGDVLTAVIDATASGTDTPATGAYCQVEFDESYAA